MRFLKLGLVFALLIAVLKLNLAGVQAQDDFSDFRSITLGGEELSAYNITHTEMGQRVAEESVTRWAKEYGFASQPSELAVYNFGSSEAPDLLVVPLDIKVENVSTQRVLIPAEDGTAPRQGVELSASLVLNPKLTETTADNLDPMMGGWQMMGQQCFARLQDSSGWIDACYKTHKLSGDGDSSKDYWQLEQYATAKSKTHWILRTAYVSARKHSSSASMAWVDWSPRSDQTANSCGGSVQIGVTVRGVGISASHDLCDKWDITKYSAAGQFKNEWQGPWYGHWNNQAERDVAYMQAISVSQGRSPVWTLSWGYSAQP